MTLSLFVDQAPALTGLGRTLMLLVERSTVVVRTFPVLPAARDRSVLRDGDGRE